MVSRRYRIGLSALLGFLFAVASASSGQDLADQCRGARQAVARHLRNSKLNSVYGTPAFDATGRRAGELLLNFTGQDEKGAWMLMSLTMAADGTVSGETDANSIRPDRFGHHEKPDVELEAWVSPEEAVAKALLLHPGHEPEKEVSLAYHWSSEFGDRPTMVLYWERGDVIYWVAIEAKYGKVLKIGESAAPRKA